MMPSRRPRRQINRIVSVKVGTRVAVLRCVPDQLEQAVWPIIEQTHERSPNRANAKRRDDVIYCSELVRGASTISGPPVFRAVRLRCDCLATRATASAVPQRKNPSRIAADGFRAKHFTLIRTPP